MEKQTKKKKPLNKQQKLMMNVLLVVCCAALIFSGAMIANNYIREHQDRNRVASDLSMFENPSVVSDPEEDPYKDIVFPAGILEQLKPFYARNSELVGFLTIEGIDDFGYPIVQTGDNEKYYRKNLDLKYSKEGTAFVDYTVNLNADSQNILIHGHNNKNGLMFGPLEHYNALLYGLDLYQKAPVIKFYTLTEVKEFKIVGFVVANIKWEDGPTFDFTQTDLTDPEVFAAFKEEVEARTVVDTGYYMEYGDTVMTLHSCCYYFSNVRFLVIARELRPGEDPEVDTSLAKIRYDAVMPDTFVDIYNLGTRASTYYQ
ncbi:MAG TPA: class B sortase [Oscillospiraceae bacterium]|nr:class B sortase [Oscillospiraceae bacterium]HPF54912.1 class B sortase [Clostridiales bacterium]HPK34971.1 class B sortase [Oscillospiraceae bacterium]HPR75529.1 class B sortase [Oscillospiraceae bacterium]